MLRFEDGLGLFGLFVLFLIYLPFAALEIRDHNLPGKKVAEVYIRILEDPWPPSYDVTGGVNRFAFVSVRR